MRRRLLAVPSAAQALGNCNEQALELEERPPSNLCGLGSGQSANDPTGHWRSPALGPLQQLNEAPNARLRGGYNRSTLHL